MNKNSNVRRADADKAQPKAPAAKKKILYIVEAMGGGVFTYIVDLSNELVNSFDMYIAYAVRPQTPTNYREYFDPRIHLIEVKSFGREIDPRKDIKAFAEVRAIRKQVKPDVIHLHSSKAGAIGRAALNGRKTQMFYTPHGYSFLMENCRPMKRRLYKFIEAFCAKFPCTTISCSEGEHRETLKLTKHALYINNGIDTHELDRMIGAVIKNPDRTSKTAGATKSTGSVGRNVKSADVFDIVDSNDKTAATETIAVMPSQVFTVFTLGRINCQKNPELFNKIAEAMPDVRFLWIGDGELRDYLKSGNIEITGWVERNKALEYSLPADVFLLTSSWEGLPISLLEAMYIKKPCIVSDVIGNRDVIHNGENGFVCDELDDYIDAIRSTQRGEAADMVNQAYKDILEKYNTKAMAESYAKLYRGGNST